MPRTKVPKNSKRNREAAIREEKIRDFETSVEQALCAIDIKVEGKISIIDSEISLAIARQPQKILQVKMGDILGKNIEDLSSLLKSDSLNDINTTIGRSLHIQRSKDDEGYITENSSRSSNRSVRQPLHTGRIPGPLNSAKARRQRRSRSVCEYSSRTAKLKHIAASERVSRQNMRTPVPRQQSISLDRTKPALKDPFNSPTALLRWPKPGERVISLSGTPVVAQMAPEQFANVNIPVQDGVLSLRPKKLNAVDPEIVQKINPETWSQIKLLQDNLNLIMSLADRSN